MIQNTFLTLQLNTIRDMAEMANGIASTVVGVSGYTGDRTSPSMTQYMANMNDGLLILNFDEPVNVSTLRTGGLILQSRSNASLEQMYRLTGGATSSENGLQVVVNLTVGDQNNIKQRIDTIFASTEWAYLQVESGVVQDMAGNSVNAVSNVGAMQARMIVNDSTAHLM